MKRISVVRLELNSVVMATHLKSFICEHVRYAFDKFYFIGDSRIVHAIVKCDTYELNSVVMATHLKSFICEHVRYAFDKFYFIGDSRIVHAIVKCDTYSFNTYAALRVREIQETTKKDEWC